MKYFKTNKGDFLKSNNGKVLLMALSKTKRKKEMFKAIVLKSKGEIYESGDVLEFTKHYFHKVKGVRFDSCSFRGDPFLTVTTK